MDASPEFNDRRWISWLSNCWVTRWLLATLLFLYGFDAALAKETPSQTLSIQSTAHRAFIRDSPEPPANLKILSASPGSPTGTDVTLAWDPNAEPVDEYRIYYDDDESGPPYAGTGASEGMSPIPTGSVTLTITGLSDTKTTYFVATAVIGMEESGYSNEVSYTPPDTTPPTITSGPTIDSKTTTTATVSWTTDEQSNSTVRYGTLSGTWNDYPFESTDAGLTTDHQIIITELEPGTVYFLRVGSTDASANGPTVSEELSFQTDPEPDTTPPIITSAPTIDSKTTTTATVSWTTDEGSNSILGYGTISGTWNDYPFQETDADMTTDHQIIITGLEPGTEYYLRAGSTDAANNGPTVSEELSFQTDPDATPPEVTITSPTSNNTYSIEATSVTLGGTASDNVGVTGLTWANDRGGNGEATGTNDWSTSAITLYSGENVITVTAMDEAGNSGEDSITITCAYAHECPDCSGDQVTLEDVTFMAGTDCSCVATVSMTIGSGVIVREGATLTISAPEVHVQAVFHAERGANIRISHQ